jgi:hypothetical protein
VDPATQVEPIRVIGGLALRFVALVAVGLFAWRLARPHLTPARVAQAFRMTLVTLLYVAVATSVLDLFMTRWGFMGDSRHRGLDVMLEHRAQRPFVYRVLTPEIIHRVSDVVREGMGEAQQSWLVRDSPLRRYARPRERWDLAKAVPFHVGYLVLLSSLLVAAFAARSLAASVYRAPPVFVDFAPAGALLLLPLTFVRAGYLYDFPELALLMLCTLCLARRHLAAYYVLFVLACLNKESSPLLVLYFAAFQAQRLARRVWLGHVAAQLLVGAAIVIGLRIAFRAAPGEAAWFNLPANLIFLIRPQTYFGFAPVYGPLVPFPLPFNLITLFLAGFAVLWRWSGKPVEVRRALLLVGAFLLPVYLTYGFLDEVRALGLAFPALYLAGFHTVFDLYDRFLPATASTGSPSAPADSDP